MRSLISPETLPSLEPKVSSLPFSFTSNFSLEFPFSALDFEMGYSFLLDTSASLAIFRQKFDIPGDVEVAYCHESEIALHRGQGTAFFPLMVVLEGGVRFPVDPLVVSTCPDVFENWLTKPSTKSPFKNPLTLRTPLNLRFL